MDTLGLIPSSIIHHHPNTKTYSQNNTSASETGSGNQGRQVFRCVLTAEDVRGHDSHQVGDGDSDTRQNDAAAFVGDVVVVPGIEEDGGCGCAPGMRLVYLVIVSRGSVMDVERTRSS